MLLTGAHGLAFDVLGGNAFGTIEDDFRPRRRPVQ